MRGSRAQLSIRHSDGDGRGPGIGAIGDADALGRAASTGRAAGWPGGRAVVLGGSSGRVAVWVGRNGAVVVGSPSLCPRSSVDAGPVWRSCRTDRCPGRPTLFAAPRICDSHLASDVVPSWSFPTCRVAGTSKPRYLSAVGALCQRLRDEYYKRAGRVHFSGRLAQLVRAAGLQPAGRGFESLSAHN